MAEKVYPVSGMVCEHCAQHVTTAVGKLPGVAGVDVDVAGGQVTVRSEAPLSTDIVRAAACQAVSHGRELFVVVDRNAP